MIDPLLEKELPVTWRLAGGLLLGTALAPTIFSWTVMFGGLSAADFPRGDHAQVFAGAFYFYRDAWRLPLLDMRVPGMPQMANVAFADSLPLLALIFKLWFKFTGQLVNFTVPWLWICVLGSASGTVLLMEQIDLTRIPETLAGIVLAVVMPPFLFRYHAEHLALSGHFVLIYGLTMYFRYSRPDSWFKVTSLWLGLLALALLTHPYLLAMQFAIFVTYAYRRTCASGIGFKQIARLAIFGLAVTAPLTVVMWLCGYLQGGLTRPTVGFGTHAMNLLAPFGAMGKGGLLPGSGHFALAEGHQSVEGFNYLGLGLLLGAALSLALLCRPAGAGLRAALRAQRALLVLALVLTVYALSDQVYVGNYEILNYTRLSRPFENITGTFRASGRFFWPVDYFVLIGVLVSIRRSFRPQIAALLLTLMVGVQWLDTAALRRAVSSEKKPNAVMVDPLWQDLVARHRAIALFPPSYCVRDYDTLNSNVGLQMMAAYRGLATNSFSSSRMWVNCGVRPQTLPHGTLTVLNPPYTQAFIDSKGWGPYCHAHQGRFYCSTGP